MSSPALLFVTATPNPDEPQAMQEYMQRAIPILAAAGGKLLGRGAVQKTIAGTPDYKMAMVLEFEDIEAAAMAFDSDDYKGLKEIRERGFSKMSIALAKSV